MARRLVFGTEARLHRTTSGAVHADLAEAWYDRWRVFLGPFDEVLVVARLEASANDSGRPVEGPGVRVVGLPSYRGPVQLISRLPRLLRNISALQASTDTVYGGRFPGVVGTLVAWVARRRRAPLLVFLVGDVHDVLTSGVAGRTGRWLAPIAAALVRRQVAAADAVVYVTESTLQARYPARPGVPTLVRSNVVLAPESFVNSSREFVPGTQPVHLIAVGSQEQLYKGHDVLIQALARIRADGVDAHLSLVGDGIRQADLRALVERLGLEQHVTFLGHLSGAARVRDALDAADLFVMPSRTEGLPRALLEAMARGLPCVGSRVGGIPELLADPFLAAPGQVDELAKVILRTLTSSEVMSAQSRVNLQRARELAARLAPNDLHVFLASVTHARSRRVSP